MRKKSLMLCLILLLATVVKGQEFIRGVISDNRGTPIAYANVVVLNAVDSMYVTGVASNDEGNFEVAVPTGDFLLHVTMLGYEDCFVRVEKQPMKLTLSEAAILMDNVVITGSIPRYRMTTEGIQTNVEGTVLSKMGTLEDVLEHLPGVVKSKDVWEVFGRGTPLIYLNGRQVYDLSELGDIKSEDVKSVEVIRNPGSKYEASSKAVIHIKTIRQEGEGFSVDASLQYSYNKYNSTTDQLTLNYRKEGFNAFMTYRYNRLHSVFDTRFEQTTLTDTLWQQYSNEYELLKLQNHYIQGGAYYEFGNRHSIGARYSVQILGNMHDDLSMDHTLLADEQFYDYIYSAENINMGNKPTHRINAYYNGKAGNTEIDLNVDFNYLHPMMHTLIDEQSYAYDSYELTTRSSSTDRMEAVKLSLVTPVGGGELSYGGEFVDVSCYDTYYSSRQEIINDSQSKVRENTTSLYAEYNRTTPIGELTLGLRYEHLGFKYYKEGVYMPEQSRTFDNLFPKLQLSKQIGTMMWQIGYAVKTRRPNFEQLDGNTMYLNRFLRQTGNPLLKHQTNHNVSLSGVWKFMQLSLDYADDRNAIIYWTEQQPDNNAVTIIRYKNEHSIKHVNFLFSAAPRVSIWSPQLVVGVQKQWLNLQTGVGSFKLNKPLFSANLNNSFNLPWGLIFNADFAYQNKGNRENFVIIKNNYVLNVGLRKSFLQDAFTLQLNGYDLLYHNLDAERYYSEFMQFQQVARRGTRSFYLTLRYNFNTTSNKYKGTGAGSSVLNRL